jgi:uracil-DNA glycosylase family 4
VNPAPQAPQAPRLSALRRLWLREIGIDKLPGGIKAAGAPVGISIADHSINNPIAAIAETTRPPSAKASTTAGQSSVDTVDPAPAKPARRGPDLGREAVDSARAAAVASGHRRQGTAPSEPAPTGPFLSAAELLALDLDGLREHVSGCTACGLCGGRRNAVFGVGARAPRWMVVGEAPGEQEDRKGEPFVGRAGQLLDDMLRAVGMSRETDVFITNVIKCRPPANRNPKPEEIAACTPYLMRQISLLKPERILVVGRFAAQTLLGTDASIGSLRGRVHMLNTAQGRSIPVVVSYHPAYLLRSPAEKARAWQDLRLVLSLA